MASRPAVAARLSSVEFAQETVTVTLTEPTPCQTSFWKSGKRFILDIAADGIDVDLPALPVGSARLSAIRWKQYDAGTVRVVLDLNQADEPRILSAPGASVLKVFVGSGPSPRSAIEAAASIGVTDAPGSTRVTDIRVERNDEERVTRIAVLTERPIQPTATWSLNSSLFLDFPGGENGLGERVFVVNDGALTRVRPVRIKGGARVALDFTQKVSYRVTQLEEENGIALEYVLPDPNAEPVDTEPEVQKPRVPRKLKELLIVLDAGHGAHDTGARGPFINEKTANLDMALRLKTLLESKGARVVMSRDTDVFVPLLERRDLAMRLKADAFISIHCNSSRKPVNRGVEVYYRRNDSESQRLSAALYRAHREATKLAGRGVRPDSRAPQGGLAVLKHNTTPCALIEVGFINEPSEGKKIADPAWRQKVAEALLQGLRDFAGGDQ